MHELSLCEGVVALIEDAAARERFSRVKTVRLDIGALGHVAPEAMTFAFDAVSRGTVADGAALVIDLIAGAGWCPRCEATVPLAERHAPCPVCGDPHVRMTAGGDLRVRELEVE